MSDETLPDSPAKTPLSGQQTYNLVTDTVIGPNVRLWDNVVQGIAVLVGLFLGAGFGCLVVEDRAMGAVLGGFLGLLAGLFGSGTFLMIYRATRHVRGKHD